MKVPYPPRRGRYASLPTPRGKVEVASGGRGVVSWVETEERRCSSYPLPAG